MTSCDEYVASPVIGDYIAYQARYEEEPRESDKVLIGLACDAVAGVDRPEIADIGCSTGNLLRHLRSALPDAVLVGGEYSAEQLEVCRNDPRLAGIGFERMDVTGLTDSNRFDVIVVNAVLYMLDDDEFAKALHGLRRALKPGGTLVVFDFFHSHRHDVEVIERTAYRPGGLRLRFRRIDLTARLLAGCGFTSWSFEPFRIPIDLDGSPAGDNASGFEDLNSRTVGPERMLFRGVLYQPWCHLRAAA